MEFKDLKEKYGARDNAPEEPTYNCHMCRDFPSSEHPDVPNGGLIVTVSDKGIARSRYCSCDAGQELKEGHRRSNQSAANRRKKRSRGFRTIGDNPFA